MSTMSPAQETLTVTAAELASTLKCSTDSVYRMANDGDIPSMRIGREWRFVLADVFDALRPKKRDPWAQRPRGRKRAS